MFVDIRSQNITIDVLIKHYPSHNIIFAETENKIYTKTIPCYDPTTGLLNTIFNDKMFDKVEVTFQIKKSSGDVRIIFGYLYKWQEYQQPAVIFRREIEFVGCSFD